MTTRTREQHHDALMEAIDYEINTYGVASLAGLIASLLESRTDDGDDSPEAQHYRAAQKLYVELSERLAGLPRPFDLPAYPRSHRDEEGHL